MDATAVSDQKSKANPSTQEVTSEENEKVFYVGISMLQFCLRGVLVGVLKHHSFRETSEVRWLVKDVRARHQIMENGQSLCQIKIAKQAVCRMLERLDAVKLVDKQRKLQHIPLIKGRLDGFQMQQLAQCKHRPWLVVHVHFSRACSDCFSLEEASSEECFEYFACACEDAGVHFQPELRVVAILDDEQNVTKLAHILAGGLEELRDRW
jgi:hypothetical protein